MARLLKAGVVALGVGCACALGYVGQLRAIDNFHVVAEGAAYRSWQPDAEDIVEFARDFGKGSVVNLRGAAPGRAWYDEERKATDDAGLSHFDFRMSATRELTPERARELIALLERAPKPVLIHCKAGADRAGLASALYLYALAGRDKTEAAEQLSLLYGHFPYLGSATSAMGRSLDAYAAAALVQGRRSIDLAER